MKTFKEVVTSKEFVGAALLSVVAVFAGKVALDACKQNFPLEDDETELLYIEGSTEE